MIQYEMTKENRNHRQKLKSYCSQNNPEWVIIDNLPKLGKEIHVDTEGIQKRKWPCLEKKYHMPYYSCSIKYTEKYKSRNREIQSDTWSHAQKKCTLPLNLEKPGGNDSYEIEKY